MASGSADTDVLRHCDFVTCEKQSNGRRIEVNRICNHWIKVERELGKEDHPCRTLLHFQLLTKQGGQLTQFLLLSRMKRQKQKKNIALFFHQKRSVMLKLARVRVNFPQWDRNTASSSSRSPRPPKSK